MRLTNQFGAPDSLVQILEADGYSKGPARLSVTELIDSPRIRVLREQHEAETSQDVMDRLWLLLGRALHREIEQAPLNQQNVIREERLYAAVRGWTVSGAIDMQILGYDGRLVIGDWKLTTTRIIQSYLDEKNWEPQLNCYAWLVEMNKPYQVTGVEIYAILRDWQRQSAIRNPEYPQQPLVRVPLRLWPREVRTAYIEERVALHQQAERARLFGERLPFCTDQERWLRGKHWRVAQPDAKRAIARAKTQEEAVALVDANPGASITPIDGVPVRCNSWCLVRDWCDQFQRTDVFPEETVEEFA